MTEEKKKPIFNEITDLSEEERDDFRFVKKRITELKEARQYQYGLDLERVWSDADKDYVPHRLKTKGKRIIATDEVLGWRGSLVTLGASDWQSDIAQPNPYIKIQTALAILVDQNPKGIFMPAAKKFQATTEIIKQLYERSWEVAKSKQQLKLFVFNLAKYGWAIARTYPLRIERKVKVPVKYDPEDPKKTKFEEKDIVEWNDLIRDNIDPWNAWIDDMTRPNNRFSMRDWAWRKVYAMDAAKEEFGKYPLWKYVHAGGTTTETVPGIKKPEKKYKEKNTVEVYFYENRLKDLFMVIANDVPIIIEPLPISDARGNKKLSCWHTYWNLRHAECPYGIGLYESIRYDTALLDRIRNMTIDQLTLSIYKMFFYQGTQALTETGDIKISPGTGKQVLDPKNINWLQVPGPGAEAWKGIEVFKKDLDDSSGITESLIGTITGKTAFEIAQAKEAALKRLKGPLDNILDALEEEGYLTVSLIDLMYSVPETYVIADKDLIEDYLKEIQGDPDLYTREGDTFVAKVYPEFPLNLEKDEEGNLTQTKDTQFFRIKPKYLKWEGVVNIKPQSVLTPSKQVDKALELEMWNILIPLLAQPPQIYSKAVKSIVKLYDKDPRDILPDNWLNEQQETAPQQLIVPAGQPGQQAAPGQPGQPGASPTIPVNPQGFGDRIVSKLVKPFRKV